jgi:DNA processing protein
MNDLDLFIAISLSTAKNKRLFLETFLSDKIPNSLKKIYKENEQEVENIKKYCQENNINIITYSDSYYPELLKQINDPPVLIYAKGNKKLLKSNNTIGIVGTRQSTVYGNNIAFQLSENLAEYGCIIVSGLAEGIDSFAHKGALENGKTIAVIGSGFKYRFPATNKMLYEKMTEKNLIISEFAPDIPPDRKTFPIRNRIIAGLSRGIVVIESALKGGSMITAQLALEFNREVFAIPGKISDTNSQGPNILIKQGAKLVSKAEDIIEEFNWLITSKDVSKKVQFKLNKEEQIIYDCLSIEPIYIDNLVERTNLDLKKAMTILSFLEMQSIIKELPGKYYIRL